jgi:hypothetical protein
MRPALFVAQSPLPPSLFFLYTYPVVRALSEFLNLQRLQKKLHDRWWSDIILRLAAM